MKHHSCPSRRRTTLRHCLLLLGLLALSLLSTNYYFTAEAALRNADREAYLSPTTLLRQTELSQGSFYFCANEDAVDLRYVRFTWRRGWMASAAPVAIQPRNAASYGITSYSFSDESDSVTYFYGRINSPEVQQLDIHLRAANAGAPEPMKNLYSIKREDFFTGPDGESYFLVPLPISLTATVLTVTALGANLQPQLNVVKSFPHGYYYE